MADILKVVFDVYLAASISKWLVMEYRDCPLWLCYIDMQRISEQGMQNIVIVMLLRVGVAIRMVTVEWTITPDLDKPTPPLSCYVDSE